jgi:hypothetical protein
MISTYVIYNWNKHLAQQHLYFLASTLEADNLAKSRKREI